MSCELDCHIPCVTSVDTELILFFNQIFLSPLNLCCSYFRKFEKEQYQLSFIFLIWIYEFGSIVLTFRGVGGGATSISDNTNQGEIASKTMVLRGVIFIHLFHYYLYLSVLTSLFCSNNFPTI